MCHAVHVLCHVVMLSVTVDKLRLETALCGTGRTDLQGGVPDFSVLLRARKQKKKVCT